MGKKISVLITSHPAVEKYLEECVQSVKAQTRQPDEIVLVLDGYVRPYIFHDVTTIARSVNKGVAYSRKQAALVSSGSHILFLDGDDTIPETFLEEMENTDADIAYPDTLLWSYWSSKPKENVLHRSPKRITERLMLRHNRIVVTSLMKREVFDKIGGFDPKLPVFEDYKFFLAALKKGFTFKKANTYMKYRQRQDSRNRVSLDIRRDTYNKIVRWYHA
jgi:glycosyltransferase involved in cell wall biosynthesis